MTTPNRARSTAGTSEPAGGRAALKQERAVRTRAQVLNAAAQAFGERGFPAVTIQDVARLTGMTKGAVYFHFPNKEALAVAVADEFYRRLPEIADAVRQTDLPPLRAVAELMVRTAVSFRDDVLVQAGARLQIERSLINGELPTPFVGFQTLLGEWLTQARQAGDLPAQADPAAVARVLTSAFFGAQHISWVQCARADIEPRVEEILDVVLPGLGGRAAA
jgi:AcrR family transcriptional regulator